MKSRDWDYEGGLNLTPLLDVILNLIFFFILATQVKETKETINVNLPKSEQSDKLNTHDDFLVITVDEKNIVYVDGEKTELNILSQVLLKKKTEQSFSYIIFQGDAKTYNQTIVSVLDECAKAGLNSVSLEVLKKE